MRSLSLSLAAVSLAAVALAGCDSQSTPKAGTAGMPMAQLPAFDQPPPRAPLLADSHPEHTPHYPVQVAQSQPLPAAVPLPPKPVIAPGGALNDGQADGGSSPAAGYAQGITDARGDGAKQELDGGKK